MMIELQLGDDLFVLGVTCLACPDTLRGCALPAKSTCKERRWNHSVPGVTQGLLHRLMFNVEMFLRRQTCVSNLESVGVLICALR